VNIGLINTVLSYLCGISGLGLGLAEFGLDLTKFFGLGLGLIVSGALTYTALASHYAGLINIPALEVSLFRYLCKTSEFCNLVLT